MLLEALQHSAVHASTRVTYLCVISILGDRRVGKGAGGGLFRDRILGAVERKEQLGSFRFNAEHVLNWVGPGPAPSPRCWPPAPPGGRAADLLKIRPRRGRRPPGRPGG